jgi:hypothetical protein
MSARNRQLQIVQGFIDRSGLGMLIEQVQQVGDETPNSHIFTLSCSCGDLVNIGFDHGKTDSEWVFGTEKKLMDHKASKHQAAHA